MGEKKIRLKSREEIEKLAEGGKILAEMLRILQEKVRPGVRGEEIDLLAGQLAEARGAECSFRGYQGFPFNLCFSLNDEVVHGFPQGKIVRAGDLVSLDLGIKYKNLFTDASITFIATDESTNVSSSENEAKRKLLKTTLGCLRASLEFCRPGFQLGDLGFAIQNGAEKEGYSVVRVLVGHGVGHAVHEDPFIPNYGRRGQGMKLVSGMVLAIEPMLNMGTEKVILDKKSGWAYKTKDGALSAHFEWTVAITDNRPRVLTPLDWFSLK